MPKNNIKSKDRVKQFGEVYTPENTVKDMLDLVKKESNSLKATFLEPSCGNGNFLEEILKRKLATAKKSKPKDYDRRLFIAVSSIYGIDILGDNIEKSRKRMIGIIEAEYKRKMGINISAELLKVIEYVINTNIIWGNALTGIASGTEGRGILIAEWGINVNSITRKDYKFSNLMANIACSEYKPIHFRKICNIQEIIREIAQ